MAQSDRSGDSRPLGRPREFDMDEVLDGAIRAFSRNGYGGTSVSELAAEMGLSQGSLYKAFGDKRAVLAAALDRYAAARIDVLGPRLATARSGRERVRLMLEYYAQNSVGEPGRRGCLVVGALTELSCSDPELDGRFAALFRGYEEGFADAIRQGQADGSVSVRVDVAATARLLLCVAQGMRVVGKTGRTQTDMQSLVSDASRLLD